MIEISKKTFIVNLLRWEDNCIHVHNKFIRILKQQTITMLINMKCIANNTKIKEINGNYIH